MSVGARRGCMGAVEIVEFGPLTEEEKRELEGDEQDPFKRTAPSSIAGSASRTSLPA